MSAALGRAAARMLVDELIRCGVRHACLSPGSRSTPLAFALDERAQRGDLTVHVILDERSAGFRALGIGRQSGTPCVVLCTSGTAAANLHPAVLEADLGRVPLIVLTADRPPELRATGANQTTDQLKLFGAAVRWFAETGVPSEGTGAYWRALACQTFARTHASPPGPVHLNMSFREPFVGDDEEDLVVPGRPDGEPWVHTAPCLSLPSPARAGELVERLTQAERPVFVAGAGDSGGDALLRAARAAGAPVIADPLANVPDADGVIRAYDVLLRHERFAESARPDLVVRSGRIGVSKPLARWLAELPEILIDADGWFLDPNRSIAEVLTAAPAVVFEAVVAAAPGNTKRAAWRQWWQRAESSVAGELEDIFDRDNLLHEPRVAYELTRNLPPDATVFVASSMPMRDLATFGTPRPDVTFHANRGLNGIDGAVSTALGIADATPGPAWAYLGDLSFLHDSNGLHLLNETTRLNILCVNNDGGGIFSFLPQGDASPRFERLFGTPHGLDLAEISRAYRWEHVLVEDIGSLSAAVAESPGRTVVEVVSDRHQNVGVHQEILEQVMVPLDELAHRD